MIEFLVRDLRTSLELYTILGFIPERRDGSFAALRWSGSGWLAALAGRIIDHALRLDSGALAGRLNFLSSA